MELFISALTIFLLRVIDQSLGTMRSLLVSKNRTIYASLIGLVESVIWILAISQVIKDIDDPVLITAYAAGFAAGTILGSYGNLANVENVGETDGVVPYDGDYMLTVSESPIDGTPQAFIAWVTDISEGDQITACFYG